MYQQIMLVFAFVIFALAAFLWPPQVEPFRFRMVALGLMFGALAFLGPIFR
jgi:hypothetical protein